ncbi:hypothetical protein A8950_1762 [Dongia mobilis]|uniref:ODP domain-containing protein n=1 Tax=Dongia mobilis TaxID=578943 RepID=A0A4R6WLV4_9PROT|nr:MBL fold metallo-hydrolase [Dongia mobilis]TDQ81942.1 hypothetical protein A8950_1762 [Dongia mobilis]
METKIAEIADGIYRLSTLVPEVAPPDGFTFNQFLVKGEEALLFHTGPRRMFPLVQAAVARIMPPEKLRWISFGHVEADECGAMNDWLGVAQRAEVTHGATACFVSLNDLADRPPRMLEEDAVLDLGGKRLRFLPTPHLPHGWEAGLFHEEATGTLLCGDLFSQVGDGPALTGGDILGPAIAAEDMFHASSLHPESGALLRRLAALRPQKLALMHGPSFEGDGRAALLALADDYDRRAHSTGATH